MLTANEMMFRDLRDRDPDGQETKPTEKDYREFKEYAVRKYGIVAFKRYMRA